MDRLSFFYVKSIQGENKHVLTPYDNILVCPVSACLQEVRIRGMIHFEII